MYKAVVANIYAYMACSYPAFKEDKVTGLQFAARNLFCPFSQVFRGACCFYSNFTVAVPDQATAIKTAR